MDVFRVFDCLNYLPNLLLGMEAAGNAGKYFSGLLRPTKKLIVNVTMFTIENVFQEE